MNDSLSTLKLPFDLTFMDLYHRDGLAKLDQFFLQFLHSKNLDLAEAYQLARAGHALDESGLLIDLAPYVDQFIGGLFDKEATKQLQCDHQKFARILEVNRQFVQRQALKKYPLSSVESFCIQTLQNELQAYVDINNQETFVESISNWQLKAENHQKELDLAMRYAAWAVLTPAGQRRHQGQALFTAPHKLDPHYLIPLNSSGRYGAWELPEESRRLRDGFSLTDKGLSREMALHQSNYCIWCHHQNKDSCSKGLFPKKEGETAKYQTNELGISLGGCPLEEKISEMNEVKSLGLSVAALSIIMIDNPMVPATGHRICNDCMKACIFQKQDPVNIPGIETQILKDVLSLPWGVEIYSLLTRWNPLNFRHPLPLGESGYKILVVGTGPAGFTLAHHLMNDGHTVIAIDGLKIEPLPQHYSGVNSLGHKDEFQPIKSFKEIEEDLSDRINGGFGGVAEYGITVRWDKNFLKLIRIVLERRSHFSLIGGVRFGGTLTVEQAFALGFDHIALCMGAGSPTLIPMKNGLAPGVRQASDFLMALQLTGAAKDASIANLQLRLPAIVIGGGLTAIDTATEAMAYYPVQVEKFAKRYDELTKLYGTELIERDWSSQDHEVSKEFLEHARLIHKERMDAKEENRLPNFQPLIQKWGGVTIAYRRSMIQSPSYTLNHEEVSKALEEGISILDHALPKAVEVDDHGYAIGLTVEHKQENIVLPARAILIAAGTKPNINLTFDDTDTFTLQGKTFQPLDENGNPVEAERSAKPYRPDVLMHIRPDQKAMSFFGDMHPSFSGNVVKAMGSAKQGYPVITRHLKKLKPSDTCCLSTNTNNSRSCHSRPSSCSCFSTRTILSSSEF